MYLTLTTWFCCFKHDVVRRWRWLMCVENMYVFCVYLFDWCGGRPVFDPWFPHQWTLSLARSSLCLCVGTSCLSSSGLKGFRWGEASMPYSAYCFNLEANNLCRFSYSWTSCLTQHNSLRKLEREKLGIVFYILLERDLKWKHSLTFF